MYLYSSRFRVEREITTTTAISLAMKLAEAILLLHTLADPGGGQSGHGPPSRKRGGLAPLGKKFFVVTKFGLPSVLVLALPWTEKKIFVYQVWPPGLGRPSEGTKCSG